MIDLTKNKYAIFIKIKNKNKCQSAHILKCKYPPDVKCSNIRCSLLQIVAETVTEVGDPKEVIREAVEKLNIQLLVLGSHGRGAIKRLVAKSRHLSLH